MPEPFKTHLGYAQQRRDPIAAAALLQQALDRLQADARRQHRALAPDLHTVRTETGRPIVLVPWPASGLTGRGRRGRRGRGWRSGGSRSRWSDRLRWVEGQLGAARDAAGLIANLPPDQIGRQVLRVADRLGLDPAGLTRAVADAVSRDGDALGRLGRRDRRDDLDRGATTTPATAAQLARTGYSAPLRSVAPGPSPSAGAHTGAAAWGATPQQRAARPR